MNKTKKKNLTRIQIDSKSPKSLSNEGEKILKNPQFEVLNQIIISKINDMFL